VILSPGFYFHYRVIAQSKITAQGQISVPADVRRKLGLGPGSILEWQEEGEVDGAQKL
jgi:AbrB family looped-hinge helix DNA binding protein